MLFSKSFRLNTIQKYPMAVALVSSSQISSLLVTQGKIMNKKRPLRFPHPKVLPHF